MAILNESYIRKIVREILSKSLITEISSEEKAKVMAKSNERIPFNIELMKQAIEQGREVGINYRSNNEKYEMPTTKSRIIHPVAMGTNKKGETVIRGLHIAGQSEKAAIETGSRSAEVEAQKDGMNAWRMFKTNNLRSMWFTGRFFSDSIPGFNPNDKHMVTKIVAYSPEIAKRHQDAIVAKAQQPESPESTEPKTQQPQPQRSKQQTPNKYKDVEQMGYENPVQEKKVRNLFK